MSYRRSWSKTFVPDEFRVEVPVLKLPPEKCSVHALCMRASAPWGRSAEGHWYLIDKLDIPILLPGTRQKLLELSLAAMIDNFWGAYDVRNWIRLEADGANIFQRDVYHSSDAWKINKHALDIDVSNVSLLDFNLYQYAAGWAGWVTLHNAILTLTAEYYSEVPPATAKVRLTLRNSKSGELVTKAYVALMSGARVVVDGYTDGGEVVFENIDEGSYSVRVLASGYYDFEQAVEVEAPAVWYEIKVVPIPTAPLPWWTWYAVGGVVALGAITVIPSMIRRKPEIVVVK